MDWIINLAHWFGSAVCHQLAANTYFLGGNELPLCARCTGMYVGALATLVFFMWRHPRSVALPRSWLVATLPIFFLAWAGDGVNSFLASIPGLPHLYPPQNALRLITGTLMGISLGSLIFVMFNGVVWRNVDHAPILATPRELVALLGIGALLVLVVQSGWDVFLYPVTLASVLAILTLNSALMTAIAASILVPLANSWRETRRPVAVGIICAFALLDTIAASRLLLGAWLGFRI